MESGVKKIMHSFSASAFGQIIIILTQLLTVPLYIKTWGAELFGEWLVINSIQIYFGMLDMGLSSIAANSIAMKVGAEKKDDAQTIFQSALLFLIAVAIVTFVLGVFICASEIGKIFNIKIITGNDFVILVQVLVATTILQFFLGIVLIGIRCSGNNAVSIWITNAFLAAQLFFIICCINSGFTVVELAVVLMLLKFLNLASAIYILKSKAPWVEIGLRKSSVNEIKKMINPSILFMGFPLSNTIKNQGVMSIIAIEASPLVVTSYYVMRTLINSAQQFLNSINSSFWTEISICYGMKEFKNLRSLYRLMMKSSFSIGILSSILLIAFGKSFISYWTHGSSSFDPGFYYVMVMASIFTSGWYTGSVLLSATNNHLRLSVVCLIVSIFTIGIIYMTFDGSLFNLAISLCLGEALLCVFVLIANNNFVKTWNEI